MDVNKEVKFCENSIKKNLGGGGSGRGGGGGGGVCCMRKREYDRKDRSIVDRKPEENG